MTSPQTEKAEGRYEMRVCGSEILSITPQVSLGHVAFSNAREAERAAIVKWLRDEASAIRDRAPPAEYMHDRIVAFRRAWELESRATAIQSQQHLTREG